MKGSRTLLALTLSVAAWSGAHADDDRWTDPNDCPAVIVNAVDSATLVTGGGTGYGADEEGNSASSLTHCLKVRDELRIVAAVNSAAQHSSNRGQQIVNVDNIVGDYTKNYGMESRDEFKIVVIGYGAGARWLLNDAAFAKLDVKDVATGAVLTSNPSRGQILGLMKSGIKVYMCQNTMKGNKWLTSDLIPGVEMVPAGVTATIDYANRGYTYINP